jgi:uncharacterized protein
MKGMLMNKWVSIFIVLGGILFSGTFCSKKSAGNEELSKLYSSESKWIDTVSIPFFRERHFTGTNLKKGKVLDVQPLYTRYYITYQSGDLIISGIMNVPKGKGPFPVLILNHGYINPKIYTNGRGLKREQDYLTKNGYVVIHPDYRNHADSDHDTTHQYSFRQGYVEDVINAVIAVKNSDYAFLDKERIGMLGHSMGGGIALNFMVTQPKLVKAFVLFGTVSADVSDNYFRWSSHHPDGDSIVRRFGHPNENPDFWKRMSPMTYLNFSESPVMIHHGTADESCPVEWARKLNDSLTAHQKNVTFYEYPNGKHEFINEWPLVMKRTVDFFDEYVKK